MTDRGLFPDFENDCVNWYKIMDFTEMLIDVDTHAFFIVVIWCDSFIREIRRDFSLSYWEINSVWRYEFSFIYLIKWILKWKEYRPL